MPTRSVLRKFTTKEVCDTIRNVYESLWVWEVRSVHFDGTHYVVSLAAGSGRASGRASHILLGRPLKFSVPKSLLLSVRSAPRLIAELLQGCFVRALKRRYGRYGVPFDSRVVFGL